MTSSHSGLTLLPDIQLEAVRGGMFGPFVNKPHNRETSSQNRRLLRSRP
jgi:hypothetical protein